MNQKVPEALATLPVKSGFILIYATKQESKNLTKPNV